MSPNPLLTSRARRSPRLPQKPIEIYPAARVETHTFALESLALPCRARARQADLSSRIDNALPRDPSRGRQSVHRVSDQPRLPAESGEPGNLTVRCHAAFWYS